MPGIVIKPYYTRALPNRDNNLIAFQISAQSLRLIHVCFLSKKDTCICAYALL